ncbi:MAG: hypothetical protein KBD27_01035 [Candidatus Moranbacteria bacterium]|nr:hypothetical protein [Candidatus Moranbacteria bacterium]
MKAFLFRTIFLLLLVLLQLSFFDILFPWFRAPLFLLGAVVVLTLVRGFPRSLWMTVPLILIFESASIGAVTWLSIYAVFFSYGTSFLSRRLLIEHQGLGLGLYALVSYGGALLYQSFFSLFLFEKGASESLRFMATPSLESLLFSLILSLPVFAITYIVVRRFEKYLELTEQRKFLNLR